MMPLFYASRDNKWGEIPCQRKGLASLVSLSKRFYEPSQNLNEYLNELDEY